MRRSGQVSPAMLPRRSPVQDPTAPSGELPPVLPKRVTADPEVAVHTWRDGGCGHTGDLWRPGIGPFDVACGQHNMVYDAFCHNQARHHIGDVVATCEGIGTDGQVYRWETETA